MYMYMCVWERKRARVRGSKWGGKRDLSWHRQKHRSAWEVYIFVYMCVCVYLCAYVCMCVCVYVCGVGMQRRAVSVRGMWTYICIWMYLYVNIYMFFFCKRHPLSSGNKLNESSIVMCIVQKNPQKRRVYVKIALWKRPLLSSVNRSNQPSIVLSFLQNNPTQERCVHENGPVKDLTPFECQHLTPFECQQVGCPFNCLGVFTKEPYKRALQKSPTKEPYKRALQQSPTKEPYKRALQKSPTKELCAYRKSPIMRATLEGHRLERPFN